MELIDEPHGVIAQVAPLFLTQRMDVLALDEHLPARRLVETTQDLQQRRLARTRSADDRQPLAREDRHVHGLEHFQRDGALLELPADVACLENGFSHVAKPRPARFATRAKQDRW